MNNLMKGVLIGTGAACICGGITKVFKSNTKKCRKGITGREELLFRYRDNPGVEEAVKSMSDEGVRLLLDAIDEEARFLSVLHEKNYEVMDRSLERNFGVGIEDVFSVLSDNYTQEEILMMSVEDVIKLYDEATGCYDIDYKDFRTPSDLHEPDDITQNVANY